VGFRVGYFRGFVDERFCHYRTRALALCCGASARYLFIRRVGYRRDGAACVRLTTLEGTVNGGWLRAAGAWRQCAPVA